MALCSCKSRSVKPPAGTGLSNKHHRKRQGPRLAAAACLGPQSQEKRSQGDLKRKGRPSIPSAPPAASDSASPRNAAGHGQELICRPWQMFLLHRRRRQETCRATHKLGCADTHLEERQLLPSPASAPEPRGPSETRLQSETGSTARTRRGNGPKDA